MEWILEVVLVFLLAATLFHAVRLERALGVLKRDRVALQELVVGFNASTRQAELGIERLRSAADGAGQQIAEALVLEREIREQQMVIHHDDIGSLGIAPRPDHVAVRELRALGP